MGKQGMTASFRNALQGVVSVFIRERNMKIHSFAAAVVLLIAWRLGLPPAEKAVLVLTIAAVISAEMINTALEAIMDRVSPEYHPLARLAKDAAAGAVLVLAAAAAAVGWLILWPRLFE